jgi:PAS domain S-box-containing protein
MTPERKIVGGSTQDLSARSKYENALFASEERFRVFMDNCPAVAVIKDEEGRYLYVNSTWRKQFYPEPSDWVGKTDYDFWPPETADLFRASDMDCLSRNVTLQSEETAIMPTRGEVTWWVMKFPLNEGGRRWIGCVAWDVSDRKRDEGTVQLLHRAIEAVPHGIIIADAELPDLPIIYASPAFEQITGYPITETIGKNCRFLQGPKSDPVAIEQIRRGIHDLTLVSVELLNYRKDGTTFINALSISPVFTAGRLSHFVGIASDVTERRNLEDQFRQAQKMEAVGILAGGISHDFNNLLTVILGYCDIVFDELTEGPTREYVREIRNAGNRAAALTRQLLAFSRKSVLEPRVLDVNDLVWNMGKLLRRLIGEDIDFVTSLDPNLGRVRADPGQLEQVVMNLCINARDAMPQGGRVTIETRNVELGESTVKLHPEAHVGQYVLISVSDTGKGMTDEVKSHVFEPFFTTKGPSKGTGLGLALVFGFVQQSGGHIELTSEPDQGAEFKIYLPRIVERPATPKSHPKVTVMPKGGETILVVEDEEHVRELTRRVLESCGYVVLEAAHGRDALELAKEYPNPIHLLISDVVMPQGMDGRQVADALQPQHPEMKVLFVSGFTENTTILHGVLEGDSSFAFLQKPFTPTALTHKVRDVLDDMD